MSSGEADAALISKRLYCYHPNSRDHYDNPSRFYCPDCKVQYADYGKGYQPVTENLGEESVPYSHETKGYWYTRFQKIESLLIELWTHHRETCIDCEFGDCEMEAKISAFQKAQA